MLSDVLGASYPEEPKDQAQGCFFKQIKALTRTPTGEMDYKEADAVNEPERRWERDIRWRLFSFCQGEQSVLVNEREGVELDETESTEGDKDDQYFPETSEC